MKLNKEAIKGALQVYMSKYGFTLQELEQAIVNKGVTKEGADDKKKPGGGVNPLSVIPGFGSPLMSGVKLMGGIAGAAGGLAGLGAYGAYNQFQDSDNKINNLVETRRKIEAANREIESLKVQRAMGGGM